MDEKAFLEINLLDIKEPLINELKRFMKESFNSDDLASVACDLKYTKEIKSILANEINNPSEEFVKFFAKKVNNVPFTQGVREKFTPITKNALNQFINDKINERLQFAMTDTANSTSNTNENIENPQPETENVVQNEIVTTEEELQAYYIVKSILCENLDIKRISIRDKKNHCGILLDDNNRKPICRLYFNGKNKYLGLFADNKNEEKIAIEDLNDIYSYAEKLKITFRNYENNNKVQVN